jgi:type II secretory pathway pseudopilin PulG
MGVNPTMVRSDDDAKEIIAAEQQAQAQAAQQEQASQMAQTAKTASETSMDDGNALTNLLQQTGLQQ